MLPGDYIRAHGPQPAPWLGKGTSAKRTHSKLQIQQELLKAFLPHSVAPHPRRENVKSKRKEKEEAEEGLETGKTVLKATASVQVPASCSVCRGRLAATLKQEHNLTTALGVLRSLLA